MQINQSCLCDKGGPLVPSAAHILCEQSGTCLLICCSLQRSSTAGSCPAVLPCALLSQQQHLGSAESGAVPSCRVCPQPPLQVHRGPLAGCASLAKPSPREQVKSSTAAVSPHIPMEPGRFSSSIAEVVFCSSVSIAIKGGKEHFTTPQKNCG